MAESQKTDGTTPQRGRPKGSKDSTPRKKRTDNPMTIQHNPDLPEGYNTRYIQFMQAIVPTKPLDKNDVPEMERRFQRYLQICAELDQKVGNMGAYTAIGITKDEARDWLGQEVSNPERSRFVKKVKQICALYREGLMADGKVNPVTGIFWQKNYDGLRDAQEHIVVPAQPLGEIASGESLANKYLDNATIASDHRIESPAEED